MVSGSARDTSHRPDNSADPAATFWDGSCSERCSYSYIEHRSFNMDPLKLLSRSTKLQKKQAAPANVAQLPSGQQARPQLYASERNEPDNKTASRKRKRGQSAKSHSAIESAGPDFFGGGAARATESSPPPQESQLDDTNLSEDDSPHLDDDKETEEEARKILKQHKLKMTWLNPSATSKKSKKTHSSTVVMRTH